MPHTKAVACPHCSGTVALTPELAGKVVGCPHCKQQFKMPTLAASFLGASAKKPNVIRVNDTGDVLVLQPGEDFFRHKGSLIDDPDVFPENVLAEPPLSVEQSPKLSTYLWRSALIGASLPFFTCCVIAGGRIDVPAILGALLVAALIGGLLGGGAGWVLYDGATTVYRQEQARAIQEHQRLIEERRKEVERTRCPSCSRAHARIELVRGTILSGPVESRSVLKKRLITRQVSNGSEPGRTYQETVTSPEPARTRRSYHVSLYKCRFCNHTWEDRDDEGYREIGPDGHPLANFAYESLHDAVGRKLRGG